MVNSSDVSFQQPTSLGIYPVIRNALADPLFATSSQQGPTSRLGFGSSASYPDNIVFIDTSVPDYQSLIAE